MKNYLKKINFIRDQFGKFNTNEIENVMNVLSNNKKVDYVKNLEDLFCKIYGVSYAIACNSATSGLHSALFSLNLKKGSEVIIPGLTVVMDAYAVIHLGLKPIFCDVDPDTFLIKAEYIEKKITKKTKAIMLVSLQGLPVDVDPIKKLAKKFNLKIIEDNAQDFLGRYKNKLSGMSGDIGVWSFENKKHLSGATEGGIVATNNKKFAERIRKFAGIGYKNMTATGGRTSLSIEMVQNPNYERFDTIGLNYRMPQIVAAVCYAQLKNAKNIVNKRRKVAEIFRKQVQNCNWLIEQKIPNNTVHSHYTFSVKFLKEKLNSKITWKTFYKKYKNFKGDGFYGACVPPHLEPPLKKYLKRKNLKIPKLINAEKIQKQIMQFKTNYRNLKLARQKSLILKRTINFFDKKYAK